MKILKLFILTVSFLLANTTEIFAFGWSYKYFHIDSISKKNITAYIDTDLKHDSIPIFIISQEVKFGQEIFDGKTRSYNIRPLTGVSRSKNRCVITDMKLTDFNQDTLFATCVLTIYDKYDELIAYYNKYEIKIPRHELKGIISGPTKRNRTTIKVVWASLWVLIAGLSYYLYSY
ncbi:MAG: hypothetical protein SNJ71_06845 [Bacteroidales bacterium]